MEQPRIEPTKLVFGQEVKLDISNYQNKRCIFISKGTNDAPDYYQIYISDESVLKIFSYHVKPEPYPSVFAHMQQVMCGRTEHNEWYGPYHYTGMVKDSDGRWKYCTLEGGTFTECKAYTIEAQKQIAQQQSLKIIEEIQKLKYKLKELENFKNATH